MCPVFTCIVSGRHIGFIAQDLEKIEPSLVFTEDSGFKAIHYANLVSLLSEAIKEQQVEINDLKKTLNLLIRNNNINSERKIRHQLTKRKKSIQTNCVRIDLNQ